jgi:hypothetical protein
MTITTITAKRSLRAVGTGLAPLTPTNTVGTGVSSPLTAQPQTRNPCPWEPATRVQMGQARTGVFLFPSAVFGEENPCPYGHLTEYVGVNGASPVPTILLILTVLRSAQRPPPRTQRYTPTGDVSALRWH